MVRGTATNDVVWEEWRVRALDERTARFGVEEGQVNGAEEGTELVTLGRPVARDEEGRVENQRGVAEEVVDTRRNGGGCKAAERESVC